MDMPRTSIHQVFFFWANKSIQASRGLSICISPWRPQSSTRRSPVTNTTAPAACAASTSRASLSRDGSCASGTQVAAPQTASNKASACGMCANFLANTSWASDCTKRVVTSQSLCAHSTNMASHNPANTVADNQTLVSRNTFMTHPARCPPRSTIPLAAPHHPTRHELLAKLASSDRRVKNLPTTHAPLRSCFYPFVRKPIASRGLRAPSNAQSKYPSRPLVSKFASRLGRV